MRIQSCVSSSLLLLVVLALPVCAADYTVRLAPDNTTVEWTLAASLHTVHGTFRLKRGMVAFDPDSNKASGEVVVDLASGESGNEGRDKDMQSKVLETAKYPEAVFTPDRFEGKFTPNGDSTVKLHGAFKIHGVAHELTMDVHAKATADHLDANITFRIPFVAWGMKDPSNFVLKVGKSVDVAIHANSPLKRQ